jgi:hypothetical protein
MTEYLPPHDSVAALKQVDQSSAEPSQETINPLLPSGVVIGFTPAAQPTKAQTATREQTE